MVQFVDSSADAAPVVKGPTFEHVEFVSVGMGKAVHAPFIYRTKDERQILGAQCDQTSWSGRSAKKIRPIKAEKITCGRCQKIVGA